jgi:hypothetical protein|nr:MAG TPA: hypothetical protein [Bacteriophage sp.]
MTYEEEDVFAIAFLKGAASVDDVMNLGRIGNG